MFKMSFYPSTKLIRDREFTGSESELSDQGFNVSFFRLYSFKDQIILSADHNEKAMAPDVVKAHMQTWVKFIRLILK
jgi:hypothetical protein